MNKPAIIAALVMAALTLAPVPVITGTALAQRACTSSPNCPGNGPSSSTYSCTTELGYLRRVYEEDLDAIEDPNRVWVTPVCSGEDVGIMRNDGNAGALRGVIADNDALLTALLAKQFRPEDVVGIRMIGDDAVTLYVHEFHH